MYVGEMDRRAKDRQALQQLCRYITGPALANERVQYNATPRAR